jgi:hypothetical protein
MVAQAWGSRTLVLLIKATVAKNAKFLTLYNQPIFKG